MKVGKVIRVPLRDVWKHEATGFTRWLETNVEILNEILGLKLPGAEREKTAGVFSVDPGAEDQVGGSTGDAHPHLGVSYCSRTIAQREVKVFGWCWEIRTFCHLNRNSEKEMR